MLAQTQGGPLGPGSWQHEEMRFPVTFGDWRTEVDSGQHGLDTGSSM